MKLEFSVRISNFECKLDKLYNKLNNCKNELYEIVCWIYEDLEDPNNYCYVIANVYKNKDGSICFETKGRRFLELSKEDRDIVLNLYEFCDLFLSKGEDKDEV